MCVCVITVDCWDGPDNEPIIYHGYTLTSKILFKDVIKAVKEYGFKASPWVFWCLNVSLCYLCNKIKTAFLNLVLSMYAHGRVANNKNFTQNIMYTELLSPKISCRNNCSSKNALKDTYFCNRYPVILSLENHCSMEQQSVMAQHMDRILGDMIWAPDSELTATPTPESLKYKVIIKVKILICLRRRFLYPPNTMQL